MLVPSVAEHDGEDVTGWDLEGLVPFAEAKAKWPSEVQLAAADLQVVFDRVAKALLQDSGPLDEFRSALTMPPIGTAETANYFYAPSTKKLFVRHWGATPPGDESTFTHESWRKIFRDVGAASPSAMAMAAAKVDAPAERRRESDPDAAREADEAPEKHASEPPGPKKPAKKQTWWSLPLGLLLVIVAGLVGLLSFRTFQEGPVTPTRPVVPPALAAHDAGTDAATTVEAVDASTDAAESADASVADSDDASTSDASADAADASTDDDDDADASIATSHAGADDHSKVVVTIGPAAGGADPEGPNTKAGPHRRHDQPEARTWRVTTGADRVARTEQRPHRFDVWLATGKSFEGVRVEWEDAAGKWHVH
ncbi:hypothetical protein AKJ09_09378 [Labilithrix luteola]|uniref:Uncharacterized protein n=1 Tax=Labilithrix luteola TaxID=1391654 RepID=A0A0K1QBE2_9BACT|nr:hypothetical protein AKJ09_09378 [Labilithrix luteola]